MISYDSKGGCSLVRDCSLYVFKQSSLSSKNEVIEVCSRDWIVLLKRKLNYDVADFSKLFLKNST